MCVCRVRFFIYIFSCFCVVLASLLLFCLVSVCVFVLSLVCVVSFVFLCVRFVCVVFVSHVSCSDLFSCVFVVLHCCLICFVLFCVVLGSFFPCSTGLYVFALVLVFNQCCVRFLCCRFAFSRVCVYVVAFFV